MDNIDHDWKRIQTALGLVPDGIPGPQTRAAILDVIYRLELLGLTPAVRTENLRLHVSRGLRARLVRAALAEVGVRERPPGSNRGGRIEEYQAATWLAGTGWPYCAAFVCWCVREALKGADSATFDRPQTAGAWDFERWAHEQRDHGVELRGAQGVEVHAGDIVVFTFSHIGIAVGEQADGHVPTVEANTDREGRREGGGVWRKLRPREQIRSVIRLPEE